MDTEPHDSSHPLLDISQLDTFVMLGYEDYADLLKDVKNDVPEYFNTIRQSIATGDAKACRAASHSCRGMLSYFGCVALTHLLDDLENGALPGEGAAESTHAKLVATWEKTLTALQEWEKSVPDFSPPAP